MSLLSAKLKCRNCLSQKCDGVFLRGSLPLQNTPFPHLIFPYLSNNLSLGFVQQGWTISCWLQAVALYCFHQWKPLSTKQNYCWLLSALCLSLFPCTVYLMLVYVNFFPKQLRLIFTLQLSLSFSLHCDKYSMYSKSENTAYFSCPQHMWSGW